MKAPVGGAVVVAFSSFHPPRCSTRDPPHEQLLMRLGVGGVSVGGAFVGRVPCHPLLTLVRRCLVSFPPFIPSSCTCTPYPPRKQLLTAVVWASPCPPPGVPPLSWSSPFPFVSVSLPLRLRLPSPSSLSPFPSVVTIVAIVPPVIHPMGSCSWGWGWVVCRSSPWVVLGRFLSFGVVLMLAVVFPSSSWGHSSLSWGPGAHFHRHR
jgi:hypothetical protein